MLASTASVRAGAMAFGCLGLKKRNPDKSEPKPSMKLTKTWINPRLVIANRFHRRGLQGGESQRRVEGAIPPSLTGSEGPSWLFLVLKPVLTRWKPTVFARFGLSMNRFFVNDIAPFHFRTKYIGSVRRS